MPTAGKRSWWFGALVAALAVAGQGSASPPSARAFAAHRVLVGFTADAGPQDVGRALAAVRGSGARRFGASRLHLVTLPPTVDEEDALDALRDLPAVDFAERDEWFRPAATTPDDPMLASQWHLQRVNAPAAWDVARGTGVTVAVLDTGVDATHPDLATKLLAGWNFHDGTSDVRDVTGHGTVVAGVVGASTGNGAGVASLAWDARILPIRICDAAGAASLSAMSEGLVWAADQGARVASISYPVTGSRTLATAATYFESRGGVVVVASGNDGYADAGPDDPHVLTVGATDSRDAVPSWSNRGTSLDLCAPGVSVLSTLRGGSYGYETGTSLSAPLAAAGAALVLSVAPDLPPQHVMSLLRRTATDLGPAGWDGVAGAGRLEASNAVLAALAERTSTAPIVQFATPVEGGSVLGETTVRVEACARTGIARVALRRDGVLLGELTAPPYAFTWNTYQTTRGSHVLEAVATDTAGAATSASVTVQVDNPADVTAPSVRIVTPSDGWKMGKSATVSVQTVDDVRVVRVDLVADGVVVASSTTAPFTTVWAPRKVATGQHKLHCVARDAAGNGGLSQVVTILK
jgi:thermitase